jgi:hypothetical protein
MAATAAGFPLDGHYQNLADYGLINVDRSLYAELKDKMLDCGRAAAAHAGQRLLGRLGEPVDDQQPAEIVFARISTRFAGDHPLLASLDELRAAETSARVASGDTDFDGYREALALWLDMVEEVAARMQMPSEGTQRPEPAGRAMDHESEDAFERLPVEGYM